MLIFIVNYIMFSVSLCLTVLRIIKMLCISCREVFGMDGALGKNQPDLQ